MSDAEIRARGAAQLLENPLLVEALDAQEHEAVEAWLVADNGQARDEQWMRVRSVRALRNVLQAMVDNGKYEASRVAKAPMP